MGSDGHKKWAEPASELASAQLTWSFLIGVTHIRSVRIAVTAVYRLRDQTMVNS